MKIRHLTHLFAILAVVASCVSIEMPDGKKINPGEKTPQEEQQKPEDKPDSSGTGGSGSAGTHTSHSWFELPVMTDKNADGICDTNTDLYYASHSFTMDGRTYRNYTVCFSASKHCPVWVAAPRASLYEKKGVDRTNAYKADTLIPPSIQYSSTDTGGGCNKGHMLGSAERVCCREANEQVFYFSNIAPQLSSGFNTGGGGWNNLEDWVDTQMPASDTLYEVIGCYFDTITDGYGFTVQPETISFGGRSDVVRPTMFYYVLLAKKVNTDKTVAQCSASELKCAAFVRAHTNSLKGQRPTSKEMMSVAALEKITGFTYFANVPNAPKNQMTPSDWGL